MAPESLSLTFSMSSSLKISFLLAFKLIISFFNSSMLMVPSFKSLPKAPCRKILSWLVNDGICFKDFSKSLLVNFPLVLLVPNNAIKLIINRSHKLLYPFYDKISRKNKKGEAALGYFTRILRARRFFFRLPFLFFVRMIFWMAWLAATMLYC